MKSTAHSEEDDFVPELHRNVHPRERPDWEEALSAMVSQLYVYIGKRDQGSIIYRKKHVFIAWFIY